jgi:predicted metal-dependent hydrolase
MWTCALLLQRMKTRWEGCNHLARHVRLNTELMKQPRDQLGYVIVHEMIHLLELTHNERFIVILAQHCPAWREARGAKCVAARSGNLEELGKHASSPIQLSREAGIAGS